MRLPFSSILLGQTFRDAGNRRFSPLTLTLVGTGPPKPLTGAGTRLLDPAAFRQIPPLLSCSLKHMPGTTTPFALPAHMRGNASPIF